MPSGTPDRTSDNLVVTRAGSSSLHPRWLDKRAPGDFDLLVAAYAPDAPTVDGPGVQRLFVPGRKVEGYAKLLRNHRRFLERYRRIALIDDDIDADATALAECFRVGAERDLKIWQPSLTKDSHFTYAAFVSNPRYFLRYVNYVEMMCPFFRTDILFRNLPLFLAGYESGIDLVWCNVVADGPRDFAVIDGVAVRHTRPVGTAKAANGFVGTRRYEDDIHAALARWSLPWLSAVPYAGERHDGTIVTGRWRLLADALAIGPAAFAQATAIRTRLRSILVHWSHILRQPPKNVRVEIAEEQASGSDVPREAF
jgi:hypothetical protein